MTYIAFVFFTVIIGYVMGNLLYDFHIQKNISRENPQIIKQNWNYRGNFNIIIYCIIFFLIFYMIDFLFIKQGNFDEGPASARLYLSQGSGGLLESMFRGIILLSAGFGIIVGAILVYLKSTMSKRQYSLCIALYLFSIVITLTTGVRNYAFFSLLFLIIAYFSNPDRRQISTKSLVKFGLLCVVVVCVFGYIFQQRYSIYRNFDARDYVSYLSYVLGYQIFENITELNLSDSVLWISMIPMMLYNYFSQGLYVLNDFINAPHLPEPFFGAYNFGSYFGLFSKIGLFGISGESIVSTIEMYDLHPGSYNTLFGAAILDFGIVGSLFFVLLLVIISQINYRCVLKYNRQKIFTAFHLLNIYFCLLFGTAFIYSLFGISVGAFIPLNIIILSLFNLRFRKNVTIKLCNY